MNRISGLASQLLVLGAVCGLSTPTPAQDTEMIVGGTPAKSGEFPWQVRLYQSMEDDKGLCGGSFITDQWVVTAAHCVVTEKQAPVEEEEEEDVAVVEEDDDAAEMSTEDGSSEELVPVESVVVGYGSIDRTETTKIESEKIFVYPKYLAEGLPSGTDIALIKLKEPAADAEPIALANPQKEDRVVTRGVTATVSGWGAIWDPQDKEVMDLLSKLTSPDDFRDKLNFPRKLHRVDIHVMDRAECREIYRPSRLNIADSEICAMKPGAASNSCYGDSGGPLVVADKDETGKFVQIGVVSWGDRCGRLGSPNVFARVSSFSDWVEQTMADAASTSEPGAPETVEAPAAGDEPVQVEVIITKPKPSASEEETSSDASPTE